MDALEDVLEDDIVPTFHAVSQQEEEEKNSTDPKIQKQHGADENTLKGIIVNGSVKEVSRSYLEFYIKDELIRSVKPDFDVIKRREPDIVNKLQEAAKQRQTVILSGLAVVKKNFYLLKEAS